MLDGFVAYAPELMHNGDGFKAEYYANLAVLENDNFWFTCRNQLIIWALATYRPAFDKFLEVGCGTGFVLSGLAKVFKGAALYGSELFTEGLKFATSRMPHARLMQMDATDIPFYREFDVIGAFDVIEHIQEDLRALLQMHAALKPDGMLMITVPQHKWLWSEMDVHACHIRRYEAKSLHNTLKTAGFRIVRSTSFVSLLLPFMVASRIRYRRRFSTSDASSELKLPPRLNAIFSGLIGMELSVIKRGANLPVGGSRLVIARKV